MTRKEISEAATALGRKGARKGGLARAASLTGDERSAIARKAALARHAKARKRKRRPKRAA